MKPLHAAVFFAAVLLAPAAPLGAQPDSLYFQQFVRYAIDVRLNTEKRMLSGMERIVYVNHSPDTLRQIFLHLYPNAFESKQTALMRDYLKRFNRSFVDMPEKYRSYLRVSDVRIDGSPVVPEVDETVAQLALPAPLMPQDSIEVTLVFEEKIPAEIARSGYRGDQYDISQWYPKVAVYDQNGWHAEKLRAGEFYGEFGVYDVRIMVPAGFVVAATGELREGDAGWSLNPAGSPSRSSSAQAQGGSAEHKTLHFHAENVHDFAWSASPRFAVQDSLWKGIAVQSVFNAGSKAWQDSALVRGIRVMDYMSERVGLYPYPKMTIVQSLMPGGMEYPMLIMDHSSDEGLTAHEIAHSWFYGALANDENREAWLDEGFVSYYTARYLVDRYGPHGDPSGLNWYRRITPRYTLEESARRKVIPLLHFGYGERIATPAMDFKNDYSTTVYEQAALMLNTLRYVVGSETFETIVQRYYDQWKFKHVNEARFQSVCEEVSGRDLDWFFGQWLHTRKICDYRLASKETRRNESGSYVTRLTIEREGEITIPLLADFTFRDGSRDTASVATGRLRTIEQTFTHAKEPKSVALNPKNEILDVDLRDNCLPRRFALQIDWPKNNYYPEDAYQIRHHPFAWYNDVDGARAGYVLHGSRYGYDLPISLGAYYGFDSHRMDFRASARHPLPIIGERSTISVSGYKLEGRQDANVVLSSFRQPQLSRPPRHRFALGLQYHELRNERYIKDPFRYQTGPEIAPYAWYSVNPQFDLFGSDIRAGLRLGRNWLGGDFKYTKFEGSLKLSSRTELLPIDTRLRLFVGITEDRAPLQQKFYLAGGGPLAEEQVFFLRSPGGIPKDLKYQEPGHGNLRGYLEGDFGVNSIAALNFELGGPVPVLSRGRSSFLGRIEGRLFADFGWNFDSANPIPASPRISGLYDAGLLNGTIMDAGVGFTLSRALPFWDAFLRFDIPFYVNKPAINGESKQTEFRYVFSLSSIF